MLCVQEPKRQVLSHARWRKTNLFITRPASSKRTTFSLFWNRPLFLVRRIRLLAPITAGCGRSGRDAPARFSAFTLRYSGIMIVVFGKTFPDLCRQFNSRRLLGFSYPPVRHRDRIHTPVEYATHETSQTAVGGAGRANVAACFTALGVDGKAWTTRAQRERKVW